MLCGINLVLLRGLGREAGHWLGFNHCLQAECEQQIPGVRFTCYTPDIPGCGSACRQATPLQISAISDSLRAGFPGPSQSHGNVFVGLSMGGMIALDVAQRFPELVDGVVLINSSTASQKPWQRIKPQAMWQSLFSLIAPQRWREVTMLSLVSNQVNDTVQNAWLSIQEKHPVSRRNLVAMLWAASRFRVQRPIVAPGLVISSLGDRMVAPSCSQALSELLAWPLQTHSGAGHDLPLDAPQWLAECIAKWLATEIASGRYLKGQIG